MMHAFDKKGVQLGENKNKSVKLRIRVDRTNFHFISIVPYHRNIFKHPSFIAQVVWVVLCIGPYQITVNSKTSSRKFLDCNFYISVM